MTVYVGIVAYNSLGDLPACLVALQAQTFTDCEIVVLDNNSPDEDTAAWMQEHAPHIRFISSSENLGYGRGHNTMIEACHLKDDDYYLALNPDAQLAPDYISALVTALENHHAGWGIGQLNLLDEHGNQTDLLYSIGHGILSDGYAFNIGYRMPQSIAPDDVTEIFGAPGAAVLYSAPLITDLSGDGGFFDADLFLYYEDIDVDWRAQARGWRCVFVPQAVAWHRGSTPHGDLKMQSLANRYAVAIKNGTDVALWLNYLPRLLLHIVARLILTPSEGKLFVTHLRRVMPCLWEKRKITPRLSIQEWVHWSEQQPTAQPRSLMQRWQSFRHR